MRVVVFTGMPGSGKSEAVAVARGMGLPVVRMGDMVLAEVGARGLAPDPKNMGFIASELRRTDGPEVWAKRTIVRIDEMGIRDIVIIDGLRSLAELGTFKKRYGTELIVISIEAPKDVRFARLKARGRSDDSLDRKGFEDRDARELSWGIGEAIASADMRVDNEGTIDRLRQEISDILGHWMGRPARKRYETFDHIADIGVRGWGATLEESFENGAKAMFTVMFEEGDLQKVARRKTVPILCEADDRETLFVEWLNAILSKRDMEGMVFFRFHVTVSEDGHRLTGTAGGEPFDQNMHKVLVEVKAATYSQLKVEEKDASRGGKVFMAQCIVDV